MCNVSRWPKSTWGAEGPLEAVSFKKATESMGRGRVMNVRWEWVPGLGLLFRIGQLVHRSKHGWCTSLSPASRQTYNTSQWYINSFEKVYKVTVISTRRRAGRPRLNWIDTVTRDLKSIMSWPGKTQSKQQSTEKTGVDVWPNVSLTL